MGVPRVTAEHRLCETAQWEKIFKNPKQKQQQNLVQRKSQKKTKLSTVFLIKREVPLEPKPSTTTELGHQF